MRELRAHRLPAELEAIQRRAQFDAAIVQRLELRARADYRMNQARAIDHVFVASHLSGKAKMGARGFRMFEHGNGGHHITRGIRGGHRNLRIIDPGDMHRVLAEGYDVGWITLTDADNVGAKKCVVI